MFCHSPNLEDANTKYGPNCPYQWTMDMVYPSISSLANLTSFTFLNSYFDFIIAMDKRWCYTFTKDLQIYKEKCRTFTFTSNQETMLKGSKAIILVFHIQNKICPSTPRAPLRYGPKCKISQLLFLYL